MPQLIDVVSSAGTYKVTINGEIKAFYPEDVLGFMPDGFMPDDDSPDLFDMAEWVFYHRSHVRPDTIDILDLGYWTRSGRYEPAEMEWREERVRDELQIMKDYYGLVAGIQTVPVDVVVIASA